MLGVTEHDEAELERCVWLTTDEVKQRHHFDPEPFLAAPGEIKSKLAMCGHDLVRVWLEASVLAKVQK